MLVVGVVKEITTQVATPEHNPYNLAPSQRYVQCSLQRLENIVGFEGDEAVLTNYEFVSSDT
jgi:hypothetical protein